MWRVVNECANRLNILLDVGVAVALIWLEDGLISTGVAFLLLNDAKKQIDRILGV